MMGVKKIFKSARKVQPNSPQQYKRAQQMHFGALKKHERHRVICFQILQISATRIFVQQITQSSLT